MINTNYEQLYEYSAILLKHLDYLGFINMREFQDQTQYIQYIISQIWVPNQNKPSFSLFYDDKLKLKQDFQIELSQCYGLYLQNSSNDDWFAKCLIKTPLKSRLLVYAITTMIKQLNPIEIESQIRELKMKDEIFLKNPIVIQFSKVLQHSFSQFNFTQNQINKNFRQLNGQLKNEITQLFQQNYKKEEQFYEEFYSQIEKPEEEVIE